MRRRAPEPQRKVLVVITHGTGEHARVLMLRRSPPKPDEWQPVTGNLEPGEDLATAAAREAWEETGIRGPIEPLGLVHKYAREHAGGERTEFEEHAYHVRASALDVSLSTEHRQYTWAPAGDAAALARWPHQREAIAAAAARVRA